VLAERRRLAWEACGFDFAADYGPVGAVRGLVRARISENSMNRISGSGRRGRGGSGEAWRAS
jgi:hypothetical protein